MEIKKYVIIGLFLLLSSLFVIGGNVIVQDGNLDVEQDLDVTGDMVITGNVGIGTTGPGIGLSTPALTIESTINTLSPVLELSVKNDALSDGNEGGQIDFYLGSATQNRVARIVNEIEGTSENSGHLLFYTSNAGTMGERVRITNNGNVGIGTASPGSALDVVSSRNNEYITVLGNSYSGGNSYGLRVYTTGSTSNIVAALQVDSGGSTVFQVSNSGNVGIGTTNPVAELHAVGSNEIITGTVSYVGNLIVSTDDKAEAGNNYAQNIGGTIGLGGKYSSDTGESFAVLKGGKETSIDGTTSGYFTISTRNVDSSGGMQEQFRITSTGNVGIGGLDNCCTFNVNGVNEKWAVYGHGTTHGVLGQGSTYGGYFVGNLYASGTCSGPSGSCDQDIVEKWVSEEALKYIHCDEDRFDYADKDNMITAEDVCILDSEFELEFEEGDVICFERAMNSLTVIKYCDKAYDRTALSTLSYNATFTIGPEFYPYPVALAGNIPMKVICDNPINPGDPLVTSDVPGYAMKLNISDVTTFEEFQRRNDGIFAKALESCESGKKLIRAWV